MKEENKFISQNSNGMMLKRKMVKDSLHVKVMSAIIYVVLPAQRISNSITTKKMWYNLTTFEGTKQVR